MEIKRDRYLRQLIDSRQNGFIKVVTGIRRCGKSYLLNVLFYHYLLDDGVADDDDDDGDDDDHDGGGGIGGGVSVCVIFVS